MSTKPKDLAEREKTSGQENAKTLSTAGVIREGGKVLAREDVTVYTIKNGKHIHMGETRTEHTVHAVLAHKLIGKGAASASLEEAKKAAKAAPGTVQLTDEELAELTEELGKKPTKNDIEAAIAKKVKANEDEELQ